MYYKDYPTKNLMQAHYVDESVFIGCLFFDVFIKANLKDFIYDTPEEIFPTL